MSGPLDRVLVDTGRILIELPQQSREALLAQVGCDETAAALHVLAAFAGVGTRRVVELTTDDDRVLSAALQRMATAAGGEDKLPFGLPELRWALVSTSRGGRKSPAERGHRESSV